MPVETTVTCDVCGEPASAYPSFFELHNAAAGMIVSAGVPGIVKDAPPQIEVTTRGCLRAPGLRLCLCRDHFASLEAACKDWFASVEIEQA